MTDFTPSERRARIEWYLASAEEAEEKAAQAFDPQAREMWTEVAQSWRMLVRMLEGESSP